MGWPRRRRSATPAPAPFPAIDQRGVPSHVCLSCGGNVLVVRAVFEDYAVAAWFLDAECACCGAPMTAPCPADDPTAA